MSARVPAFQWVVRCAAPQCGVYRRAGGIEGTCLQVGLPIWLGAMRLRLSDSLVRWLAACNLGSEVGSEGTLSLPRRGMGLIAHLTAGLAWAHTGLTATACYGAPCSLSLPGKDAQVSRWALYGSNQATIVVRQRAFSQQLLFTCLRGLRTAQHSELCSATAAE